jgi:predicted transcriptional regulator
MVASVGKYTGWAVMIVGLGLLVAQEGAGLFWLVAGWFLAGTAVQTGRREELVQMFDGSTAADIMHPTTDAVPSKMHIEKMVDMFGMGPEMRTQIVQRGGRVIGVIGQSEIQSVSPARWVSTPVERLMTEIGPEDLVDADEPLESLMLRPPGQSRRAVVVRDGSVIGIIEAADLGYHLERT